jgi:hypothetical protein
LDVEEPTQARYGEIKYSEGLSSSAYKYATATSWQSKRKRDWGSEQRNWSQLACDFYNRSGNMSGLERAGLDITLYQGFPHAIERGQREWEQRSSEGRSYITNWKHDQDLIREDGIDGTMAESLNSEIPGLTARVLLMEVRVDVSIIWKELLYSG